MSDSQPQGGDIRLEEAHGRSRYLLSFPDGGQAELTFSRAGDRLIADHTFVPPRFRGQGIAGKLVERMVADARTTGMRITPLCPFVAAEFRRHPEWADLLKR